MQSQAFQTLGIEPTIDGRAIRDAFVRIARIYHPDRFAGQPDDVRIEAERRMKEASAAYELLKVVEHRHHQRQVGLQRQGSPGAHARIPQGDGRAAARGR